MGMFDDVLEKVGEPYSGASGKGFEYGTHKVRIGTVTPTQKKTKANDASEVIEVEVFDPADNDRTAKATLYFHTEGGAKMSVTKVLGLLVHKVDESKKDSVRALGKKLFGAIDNPTDARDAAAKLMQEKLVGEEAFLFVDPQGKYKTSSYGDLWHYEYEDPNADERTDREADAAIEGEDITGTKEAESIPDFDDL
jgi:hypothetical protein